MCSLRLNRGCRRRARSVVYVSHESNRSFIKLLVLPAKGLLEMPFPKLCLGDLGFHGEVGPWFPPHALDGALGTLAA